MALTKMPITNTLKVMDLCNNDKDLEAMKLCGLTPVSENIPEGKTFIDRVVTVANTTTNMAPSQDEVLVKPEVKNKGVDGTVNDVVSGVQAMANDAIDESVSKIIDNVAHFNKSITKAIIKEKKANKKVPLSKKFKDIEEFMKENYPKVYSYIIKKYKKENDFNIVGIILLYQAYELHKTRGTVTVDDVKFTEDNIPNSLKKNKNNFSVKLAEASYGELDASGAYYFSALEDILPKDVFISESEDLFGINEGIFDFLKKDTKALVANTEDNKDASQENEPETETAFDDDMKSLVGAVKEYISTIPEKVKDLTNKLSASIHGKDLYVGLVVSAFVSCGAIYLIYKTNKDKLGNEKTSVAECVSIFESINEFIKKVYSVLDEDASNIESFENESDYIKGAISAAIELDSKGYESKFFETCISNIANLYDNYLSDASKLK